LQWQPLVLPIFIRNVLKFTVKERKGEAVTAVIELLMMGGKTPETC
jgi:hypothetical protein